MEVEVAPLLLTPEASADRLGIGRSQMFELLRTGQVASVKIGRLRRIPTTALEDYVAALTSAATARNQGA